MRRLIIVLAAAALAGGGLAACGDDDTAADDEQAQRYCQLSLELDEGDAPPTDEQFEALRDTAPDEIRDDVELAVARILEDGLISAFGDPEVGQAIERIEAWEQDNCPDRPEPEEPEEPVAQEPDPDAAEVTVIATEYEFEIQGDVPAGRVAFVMDNEGDEPHHLDLARFRDGVTQEEVQAAIDEGDDALFDMIDEEFEDQTSADAPPGEQAVLNADLEPGVYGLACFVPDPDGVPHFFQGMGLAFTVG